MKNNEEVCEANQMLKTCDCAKVADAFGHSLFDIRIAGKWLSTKEAASYLGITPNALRILVHRGKVKAHKLGARLRFRVRDLKSSLQSREVL